MTKKTLGHWLLLSSTLVLTLTMIEGLVWFIMSHPTALASRDGRVNGLLELARRYYLVRRNVVQFMPACARYDPELTYTLRPGACTFENTEYRTQLRINTLGVRDDEAALVAPRVVVLGDSFTMGWGVQQSEAFPERLEQDLGISVLNAGVSSFGTAREMMLLARINRPVVDAVVVQYSPNDFGENRSYLTNGNRLNIMPENAYRQLVNDYGANTDYFLGKHVRFLGGRLVDLIRSIWARPDSEPRMPDDREQARVFLDVLLANQRLIAGKIVIVFSVESFNRNKPAFITQARELIKMSKYHEFAQAVSLLEISGSLSPDDYYILDDHLNPRGHARIAALIEAELKERRFGLIH